MVEELNELEKIGLAFLSGLVAGTSLEEASDEVEHQEKTEKDHKNVIVGKIEGKSAEEFINMIENLSKKGGK